MRTLKFVLRVEAEGRPVASATHRFEIEVDDDHGFGLLPRLLNEAQQIIVNEGIAEDDVLDEERGLV